MIVEQKMPFKKVSQELGVSLLNKSHNQKLAT